MWPPPQYRERCYNPQSSLPHSTPGTDFCHHRFTWLVLELGINVIENVLTSFTQDTVGASAGPFHCCMLFHGAFTPWRFHPSHRSFQFLLISPSEHPCISLFGIYIDTFLRIYPGVEFLGHRCMLNFIRNCQFSKMDKTYSHYLIPATHGSSSCSISLFILGIFCLFNFIHSGGWEWYIVVIFISISLIIVNDVEPIFLCLLVICHFRNVQIFCLFFKKKKRFVYWFLIIKLHQFLIFILITKPLSDIVTTNIFSEFEVCIFILCMVSFEEYQSLILMKSNS